MKVVITGHLGYIGTVLTQMLVSEGYEVVGIDSDLYRDCTFGAELRKIPTINKDIRDITVEDLRGFDSVLHLAGLSNDPLGNLNPELTYEINHRASVRLAELSKKAKIRRYVFSSSCSNYGASGNDFLTEESPFHPVTPYGESKVRVEKDVSLMADDSFSPVFLRNATAFGASPRIRFDLVLNNLVAWAFTTGKVMLKSDGRAWRPIVHIEDISRAFIAVLKAPVETIHNESFNVGLTTENYLIREIAELVADVVPNCHLQFADDASTDTRNYRVNCDKIIRTLKDYQPRWTARMGAQELYEAYKKNGLKLEEFEGPQYQRIGHIRKLLNDKVINKNLRFIQ